MKPHFQHLRANRIGDGFGDFDDRDVNGAYLFNFRGVELRVVASDGLGWEHVSVSIKDRCPTWEEMCFIKNTFWGEDEIVIQFHPAKKNYVNCHPFCLHLWRPIGMELPIPDSILVGAKSELTD